MKKVVCIDEQGFSSITKNKEYEVLKETNDCYMIENDKGTELEYEKELFRLINEKIPTYAEEQLEHAQEKEDRCYNKECQNNKENKCSLASPAAKVCIERMKEPINYKVEYYKLKKENEKQKEKINTLNSIIDRKDNVIYSERKSNESLESECKEYKRLADARGDNNKRYETENKELKERNKLLEESHKEQEERIEMQKSTIIDLKESLDNKEKPTNKNNYESEINKFRCQYEEAKYYIEAKEIEIKNLNKKLEESEMTVKMIKRLVEGL